MQTALTVISADINREHRLANAAAQTAISHAINAGELLIEAKAKVSHGEWLPWLNANCELSERTARNYMRVARLPEAKRQRVADMPLRQALETIAEPIDHYSEAVKALEESVQFSKKILKQLQAGEQPDYAGIEEHVVKTYERANKHMERLLAEPVPTSLEGCLAIVKDLKLERLAASVKLLAERIMGTAINQGLLPC